MIPVLVIVTALLISSISVLTPHALAQTSPHAVSTNMTLETQLVLIVTTQMQQ
jgi:hypothetical protein